MKRLRSVETLGSTSAINSDKTGTLTLNQMTAVQMAVVGRPLRDHRRGLLDRRARSPTSAASPTCRSSSYLLPMALCADAEVRDGALVGDPTEGALVVLAAKGGVDPTLTRERYPRVATLPFDAAYKFMATFHRMTDDDGQGRHPRLRQGRARPAARARRRRRTGPTAPQYPIDEVREPYLAENERLGAQGLRVMATAPAGLRPGDVRPERRPAAAHRRPRAAGARRHRRPAADRGTRRHRQGARRPASRSG